MSASKYDRNLRIAGMKEWGVRCKVIAASFGLSEGRVKHILTEMRRKIMVRNKGEIEIRVRFADIPPDGSAEYYDFLENECIKAGIPFSNYRVHGGFFYRELDSETSEYTTFVYEPHDPIE